MVKPSFKTLKLSFCAVLVVAITLTSPIFTSGTAGAGETFRTEADGKDIFFYAPGNCVNVRWAFGDGWGASGPYVWHHYAENGTYEVTMDIGESTQSANVTVGNITAIISPNRGIHPDAVLLCAMAGFQLVAIFGLPAGRRWGMVALGLVALAGLEMLQAAHVQGYLGWWPL